jgi:hypothetical protein
MNTKFGTIDKILHSITLWDGYGVRSKMVDAVGYSCHKPPRTIHGIQVTREEV